VSEARKEWSRRLLVLLFLATACDTHKVKNCVDSCGLNQQACQQHETLVGGSTAGCMEGYKVCVKVCGGDSAKAQ